MQKTYVLDTNVLTQAPYALESFEDNHIVLPLVVLKELDRLKGAEGEQGGNARQVIRFLEGLRLRGSLVDGVPLAGGGTLRLEVNHVDVPLPRGLSPYSREGRILKVCRGLLDEGIPAVLVTRDIVSRIQAQMMGVPAEDFTTDRMPDDGRPYTGRADAYVPDALLSGFKKKGIPAQALYAADESGRQLPLALTENQFVVLHSDTAEKKSLLGRIRDGMAVPLRRGGAPGQEAGGKGDVQVEPAGERIHVDGLARRIQAGHEAALHGGGVQLPHAHTAPRDDGLLQPPRAGNRYLKGPGHFRQAAALLALQRAGGLERVQMAKPGHRLRQPGGKQAAKHVAELLSRRGRDIAQDARVQLRVRQSRLKVQSELHLLRGQTGQIGRRAQDQRPAHAEMREEHLAQVAVEALFAAREGEPNVFERQAGERPYPLRGALQPHQRG